MPGSKALSGFGIVAWIVVSGLEVRVLLGSPQFPPIFLELVLADKLALDAKLWFTLDLQNPQLVNREHAA